MVLSYLLEKSPALDNHFTDNSYDLGKKILISKSDGNILVSAMANKFLNSHSIFQDIHTSGVFAVTCEGINFPHYFDIDSYLLRININNGSLVAEKNISHFSGGDLNVPFVEDDQGNITVGCTSSDINYMDGLPELFPEMPFVNMLVQVDAGFNTNWRTVFNGKGYGNCLFGLAATRDGGYVVCGNTLSDADLSIARENYSIVKLGSSCQLSETYDANYNQPINFLPSSNTFWNSDRNIFGQVIVQAGQTLTIQNSATIRFADSKQIFDIANRIPTGIKVELGGTLIVQQNATLTGLTTDCSQQDMWDGIIVEADFDPNPAAAGTVVIDNATIQYAIYGIFAGTRSYDILELETGATPPIGAPILFTQTLSKFKIGDNISHNGGGKIIATNATFANNYIGVRYLRSLLTNQTGSFNSCTFVQTDDLPDQYKAGIYPQKSIGLKSMVYINGIKYEPFFDQCIFDGLETLPVTDRGAGIFSINSKFRVEGDLSTGTVHFKDLTTGIGARSHTGSVNDNIFVKNNEFNNVLKGINLIGTFGDIIDDNQFIVPSYVSGQPSWGIFTSGASGFKISNNYFGGGSTGSYSGLIINNSGEDGGLNWRNTYTGFIAGNQFQRNNSNIDNSCNNYSSNLVAWSVAPITSSVDAMNNQGESNGQKADNQFTDPCPSINVGDVFSTVVFNYFDKLGNPNPIADGDLTGSSSCVVGANYFNSSLSTSLECEDDNDPCPNPPCFVGDYKDKYDNSPEEKKDRNELFCCSIQPLAFLSSTFYSLPALLAHEQKQRISFASLQMK